MEILIIYRVKIFLGNKYTIYIHTAPNAKVTSTRNIYEKPVTKRKKKVFKDIFRTHLNIYDELLKKVVNGVTWISS